MSYSPDLKRKVLNFLKRGGSKAEASRRFEVSRSIIYYWLSQPADHKAGKPGPKRSRKFDEEALRAEVKIRPDALLRELAESRQVSIGAIFVALKRLGIKRKKNTSIRRKSAPP